MSAELVAGVKDVVRVEARWGVPEIRRRGAQCRKRADAAASAPSCMCRFAAIDATGRVYVCQGFHPFLCLFVHDCVLGILAANH